jgi:hypothetical protein
MVLIPGVKFMGVHASIEDGKSYNPWGRTKVISD